LLAPPAARRSPGAAYLDWIWRHHRAVLTLAALVTVGSALLAARLELRTNVAELLPSKDPAVAELHHLATRIGGTSVLQIAVESPDRDANLKLAAALTARLRALPSDVIQMAAFDVRAERQFFLSRRWLYAPLDELESLRDAIRAEIHRRKNPLYVDVLGDEPSPEAILKKMQQRGSRLDQFPSGYFEGDGGRIVAIVCRPPSPSK
jgi:hypothetical protein